jgi:hypothetical protein
MKKLLKGIGIFFAAMILLAILINVFGGNDTEGKAEPVKITNWKYSQDVDKMEGNTRYFAKTRSTNTVHFKFPFDGGSHFNLFVRNMGKKNEVLIKVSKGSFIASLMNNQTVKVKFDEGNSKEYIYCSTTDGSAETIFINDAESFLTDLKKSKKLIVQATFFNDGNRYLEFNTEGIDWNH